MRKLSNCSNLNFAGISTHPGHVYAETDITGIKKIALQECETMKNASEILRTMNSVPQFITSGSTPTYPFAVNGNSINIFHPGNYVFMDNIQISLECATENDCALTVLCSVISNPREGEFIIDGGSKCFGLDKGAHGNGKITGHGRVKNPRKLFTDWPVEDENIYEVLSLSEEVGKFTINNLPDEVGKITITKAYRNEVSLKIGDKLEIIPNHSCAVGNNTSYYIATRNGKVEKIIDVDMRGNSTKKGLQLQTAF
jgi:D-serine deaminase-like pyridoxal phosphate-dependent protein